MTITMWTIPCPHNDIKFIKREHKTDYGPLERKKQDYRLIKMSQ